MKNEEKLLLTHRIELDEKDMKKLKDAASLLTMIFSQLKGKENIQRVHAVLGRLEDLIEEIENDDNMIVEFEDMSEMEDVIG